MRQIALLVAVVGASACTNAAAPTTKISPPNPVLTASHYLHYDERTHRQELLYYTGVDPVKIEWCAAFINSVLDESDLPTNREHKYPLTARAFLDWGYSVNPDDIEPGDIVVFPRGNQGWQGHVGFYVKTVMVRDEEYYAILGGNQNNKVSIELYPARKALGIRRDTQKI